MVWGLVRPEEKKVEKKPESTGAPYGNTSGKGIVIACLGLWHLASIVCFDRLFWRWLRLSIFCTSFVLSLLASVRMSQQVQAHPSTRRKLHSTVLKACDLSFQGFFGLVRACVLW